MIFEGRFTIVAAAAADADAVDVALFFGAVVNPSMPRVKPLARCVSPELCRLSKPWRCYQPEHAAGQQTLGTQMLMPLMLHFFLALLSTRASMPRRVKPLARCVSLELCRLSKSAQHIHTCAHSLTGASTSSHSESTYSSTTFGHTIHSDASSVIASLRQAQC